MSVYFVKGKGWRYDFTLNGTRHTEAWFKTKKEARKAEAKRKGGDTKPKTGDANGSVDLPTDMDFLELVNKRLDHVKAYNSERHYTDHVYMARGWIKEWIGKKVSDIDTETIRLFLLKRLRKTSAYTANKELRYLRALFNFAMHHTRNWIDQNPTRGIDFFPVEKRIKYVPPKEDVLGLSWLLIRMPRIICGLSHLRWGA